MKYGKIAAYTATLLLTSVGVAQVTKSGTTAAKFLSVPVGARALGAGGAFTAIASDASALYWNPSGIARLSQNEAILSHSTWLADISFNYAGIVLPMRDFGTLGIQISSVTMDDMERTTEEQPEGTGNFFGASSMSIGVTYARSLTDWFAIGGTVKYIRESIWNSSAGAFAVDIGTIFNTPFSGLKFGAGVSNFGQKMRIAGDDLLVQKDISPNHGNNANINAFLVTDYFDLPLNLRIGLAYDIINSEDELLTVAVDAAHPNDNAEYLNVGAEHQLFGRMLAIRGGYKGMGMQGTEEQYTFGGGVNYEVVSGLRGKIDYAYESFGRLKSVQVLTVGIIF